MTIGQSVMQPCVPLSTVTDVRFTLYSDVEFVSSLILLWSLSSLYCLKGYERRPSFSRQTSINKVC